MTILLEFLEMRTANYTQIRSRRCGSRPSRGMAAAEAAVHLGAGSSHGRHQRRTDTARAHQRANNYRTLYRSIVGWKIGDSSFVGVEAGASPGERR